MASTPTFINAANPTATENSVKAQWDKDEHSAKSLLTQKLPDSMVVMVHGKVTVKERWDAVVKEFSKKSAYVQADMRAKFMAMRCLEQGKPTGVSRGAEGEEGRISAGWGRGRRKGLLLNYHFFSPIFPLQFRIEPTCGVMHKFVLLKCWS
jgi:hypothetical protein